MARRHLKLSQLKLAEAIGVHRSAVSQWEAPVGKNPTVGNLKKLAQLSGLHFEWLATGRGAMTLSSNERFEGVSAAHALLIDDDVEMRMITALRLATEESRMSLVDIAEQIAALRVRQSRRQTKVAWTTASI